MRCLDPGLDPLKNEAWQAFGKDTTKTLEKKAKSIADKAHFVGVTLIWEFFRAFCSVVDLSLGGVVTHQASSFTAVDASKPSMIFPFRF